MVWAKFRFDAPWEGRWLGFVANNNGSHREPKFDNEDEHHYLHIGTLQTFSAQFHEWGQIQDISLRRVR
jgi:hypothetical protein